MKRVVPGGQGGAGFGGGEGVESVFGDQLICRRAYRREEDDGVDVVRVVRCLFQPSLSRLTEGEPFPLTRSAFSVLGGSLVEQDERRR